MQKLKILSAAGTLDSFTVHSLMRLTGQPEKTVRYWVGHLERRGFIHRSGTARVSSRGRTLVEYTWHPESRGTVEREILESLPSSRAEFVRPRVSAQEPDNAGPASTGSELEVYEDPFATALSVAEQWTLSAEEAKDEASVKKYLDLASAEVRSLRSLLRDRETDQVRDCEMLARRLERLSQRPPIEAFRSRIKQVFRDALEKAALALGGLPGAPALGGRLLDEELALVLNATRRQEDTARVVQKAVGQVGRACYVFEMAQATPARRREAIHALGPLFTGPGSAAVKLFVVLDSRDGQRSHQVMDELIGLYGNSSSISNLMAANRSQETATGEAWGMALPILVMAATSMQSGDWLPRGLAKQALLQAWVSTDASSEAHEMARVTLNDPVIFDCSHYSAHSRTDRSHLGEKWAKFSYHHVALNEAVVSGLVMGSFSATSEMHGDASRDFRPEPYPDSFADLPAPVAGRLTYQG